MSIFVFYIRVKVSIIRFTQFALTWLFSSRHGSSWSFSLWFDVECYNVVHLLTQSRHRFLCDHPNRMEFHQKIFSRHISCTLYPYCLERGQCDWWSPMRTKEKYYTGIATTNQLEIGETTNDYLPARRPAEITVGISAMF